MPKQTHRINLVFTPPLIETKLSVCPHFKEDTPILYSRWHQGGTFICQLAYLRTIMHTRVSQITFTFLHLSYIILKEQLFFI